MRSTIAKTTLKLVCFVIYSSFKIVPFFVVFLLEIPLSFVNILSIDVLPSQIVHFSVLVSCSQSV